MAPVDILLRTPGGPAAAGPSGGAPPGSSGGGGKGAEKEKKEQKDPAADESKKGLAKIGSHLKGAGNFFKKNLGLQFGMSSMLKQSQVFTSFMGVIFQLMGALVDVILAPLLPLFYPVIRLLGAAIPHVQKFMEGAAAYVKQSLNVLLGWYDKAKGWLQGKYDDLEEAWKSGPKDFALAIWTWVWGGIKWVWDKLINTALPWIWDQIKGLGNTVWNFLSSTAGRIFGWFVQAYIMLSFVRTGVNKVVTWAVRFGIGILRWLGAKAVQFIVWGAKQVPKIIRFIGRQAARLIKIIFPIAGNIIIAIVKGIGRFLKFLGGRFLWILKTVGGLLWKAVKGVGGFIWKAVKGIGSLLFRTAKGAASALFNAIKSFFKTTVKTLLEKLGSMLGKLPLIGGTLKKIGGIGKSLFGGVSKIAGGVSKGIGGKGLLKAVGTVAKMSKAIPVLGSVATLGFGAVETYNNFKNHGWKAGLATAGKTIAATTLAATGNTVASMAVDMGGTLAINKFLKKKADDSTVGGPSISPAGMTATAGAAVVVNIQTQNGETLFEQGISAQDTDDMFSFDLSNDLQASEQT